MVLRIRSTVTDIQRLFLLVLYIHLLSALGESPAKLVYGKEGESITFHLEKHPELPFQDFYWTFSDDRLAVCDLDKCINYSEKASICNVTFSLELKNVARDNDGEYTAVLVAENGEVQHISTHRLIVQAPVSKPVIHSSMASSLDGRCNVTLNCTAERGTSISIQWSWTGIHHTVISAYNGSLLMVSLDPNADGSFTCKAHNQVSNSSENVPVEKIKCNNNWDTAILVIIIVVSLAAMLLAVTMVMRTFQKRRRGSFNLQNNLGRGGVSCCAETEKTSPCHKTSSKPQP
ncbi:SLAM family member 5-like [Polyodon spathula]|uniref:SLAM family member 5-like n=1 Tax=Polyodon spathula TaxID=7913 RepID=UPI001B7E787B|nr:SLAM family member 5-like [Polyodon spathula]